MRSLRSERGEAELFAAIFVDQADGGAVFFGTFEIVGRRDVIAEDAAGKLIVLEERCAGEADEGGVGEDEARVAGELARLGAVGFVGDDNDVVASAVGFIGGQVAGEFMNEAEDEALIFFQGGFEIFA